MRAVIFREVSMTGYGQNCKYAYLYVHENSELLFLKIVKRNKLLYQFDKTQKRVYNILDDDGERFLADLLQDGINKGGYP